MESVSEYEHIRYYMYKHAFDNQDYKRVDKIVDGLNNGTIDQYNYWDMVRKLTKRITSDKSAKAWQRIAECIYSMIN